MKSLIALMTMILTLTSYAQDWSDWGLFYCGKHEYHKKIYMENGEMHVYEDNTNLNKILTYSCQKFDSSFPGYEEIVESFERALTNINEETYGKYYLWNAQSAAEMLQNTHLTYCGNPNGGGLYLMRPETKGLYLFDIKTKKFESNSCMPI